MSLTKDIDTKIVEAMRARDSVRLTALRGMKAAFVNELVALKRASDESLTDDEAVAVVKRLVKQRKDSIEQFRKGGREELAAAEEVELRVLETFLPQMMSEDAIHAIAEKKKAELGITDKSKLGQLIGAVMKETKVLADGGMVKRIVESLFE